MQTSTSRQANHARLDRSVRPCREPAARYLSGAAFLLALGCLTNLFSPLQATAAGKAERRAGSAVGGSVTTAIDRVHPEAFRAAAWIEVDLPASHVTLQGLRIITANRCWTLQICESTLDLATCTAVVGPAGTAAGWRGDFRNEAWTFSYTDRESRGKLHLRVTPERGDWMTFRIQTSARP